MLNFLLKFALKVMSRSQWFYAETDTDIDDNSLSILSASL
jgi:hypothetical protein